MIYVNVLPYVFVQHTNFGPCNLHCAKHILSFGLFGNPKRSEVSKTNKKTSSSKSPCENRKSRAARRERNQEPMDFLGIDVVFRWIDVEKT